MCVWLSSKSNNLSSACFFGHISNEHEQSVTQSKPVKQNLEYRVNLHFVCRAGIFHEIQAKVYVEIRQKNVYAASVEDNNII